MIGYRDLERIFKENCFCCYDECEGLLNNIGAALGGNKQDYFLKTVELPSVSDFVFFKINYGYLTPLFVEKYADRQDAYCLNFDDKKHIRISVFSEDGIVHDWENTDDFIKWLIEKSGYLA